ncbi:sigma-70 family RNA polymerase sigma factor [Phenylobacterium soli]|uniref:RNA polymerase subunit sigma-70 n=2 Tax=Phenylobacterium soli TaxID=2170551 RepID=A0A328ATG5_9CAUL|nr:RNA polymerase subunit sigma-70 [Phenylobacterium soli]
MLMLRAQDGDAAAWRALLVQLQKRLTAYFARRLSGDLAVDVDDLVQETLIAMHTRRVTYDPAQPFTAWTHAIARYKLIDFWRRRSRRPHVALDDVADGLWAEGDQEAADAAADLDRLLASLPERQQGLIRDVKIEGLSLAEAGAKQGMSEGAAKVSLHRALKALTMKVGRADG